MSRRLFRITERTRDEIIGFVRRAPVGWFVEFLEDKRSLEQNALMWARLTQLSVEVLWDGERFTPDEWKDLFTACLRKQKVVRGIEGGLVFLGDHTSRFTKAQMSDLLTLMDAFAAERGIVFYDLRRETPNG